MPANTVHLTPAQRRYLESFRGDLEGRELSMDEQDFVQHVCGMEFDGEAQLGDFRVALALQDKGLVSKVDRHGAGLRFLSATFTEAGATALFHALRRQAQRDRRNGAAHAASGARHAQ